MRERCCVSLPLCVSLALLQQGGGFSPKRLRAMLLGVDKRRKGQQDGGADEEEDDGGGDYGVVPKDHARSDAGDGGCFCFVPPASPVLISPPLAMLPAAVADLVLCFVSDYCGFLGWAAALALLLGIGQGNLIPWTVPMRGAV